MRKILVILYIFIFSIKAFAVESTNTKNYILGKWAEKTSERVVMDIFANQNNNIYKIFITWRENNLAQKDIYRFDAKLNKDGNLVYNNGIHIYRFYNTNNHFEDKIDYTNGSGEFLIKKNEIIWIDNKSKSENTVFIPANKSFTEDTTIKNRLFTINLPEELKGFYDVKKEKNKISIYHKESKKNGFGGFAFGIKAYKNPANHAVLPGSRKIGELTDKRGILYDIVLKHPTDVQYDYTKNSTPPDSFKLLYNIGDFINIQGSNGSSYYKNQGMKGEFLYKDILKKHIIAINEKWDSTKLEHENMSYMYNVIAQSASNVLEKIGYTYYDVNADGIEELLIGEIADGNWKGVIYDIYTMVNRVPKHVVSGGSRNRYYVCDDSFICNEYSSGALESGVIVYNLVENSTELYPQISFKYDGYENINKPWFISYSDNKWKNVNESLFNERKQIFEKYERFNFYPLSKFVK